jgi:hypothetical protein
MNDGEPRTTGSRLVTNGTARAPARVSERQRQVAAAWERFAAGQDAVRGVRPNILLSWYRCRDVYNVDPRLTAAPAGHGHRTRSLQQDMLFTQLGGAAGAAAGQVSMHHTLITVTDAAGRILASWGPRACLRHGADSSLAPSFAWSEGSSGTNGMGTALERPGIALVQGAEHWCAAFQRWSCAGIAVHDPVTQVPLAALNVSRWNEELPDDVTHWLRRTAAALESELRDQAMRRGERIVEAFSTTEPKASGVVMALDLAGKVVIANEAARLLLGVVCPVPAVDPHARLTPELPGLVPTLERAAQRASDDADWRGIVELVVPSLDEPLPVELHPVFVAREVIGLLVVGSQQPVGERLDQTMGTRLSSFPPRIAAVRGSRIVLLSPQEIRYAEADSHAVWLVTDQGRLRAATRGMDNFERQLNPSTFLRVHRRFIVNVTRVKELEYGFKGALTLSTATREHEAIPVSRRHMTQLRDALGF